MTSTVAEMGGGWCKKGLRSCSDVNESSIGQLIASEPSWTKRQFHSLRPPGPKPPVNRSKKASTPSRDPLKHRISNPRDEKVCGPLGMEVLKPSILNPI